MAITLTQLLEARDNRRARQLCLLSGYPGNAPVVLTVNIPGSEKRTPDSLVIARAALDALRLAFEGRILYEDSADLQTGWESYIVVSMSAAQAKEVTVEIEEKHPLGRLMDIDVIGPDGVPVSRTGDGHPQRRCLICNDDARACMRAATNSVTELLAKIHSMTEAYVQRY